MHWTKDQKMPLAELMVLDQFLGGVPEDLRVWLKERKPESLQQAMELADDYGRRSGKRKPAVESAQSSSQVSSRPVEDEPAHQSQSRTPLTDDRSRTNSKGEMRCFQCNRFGHITVNCPNREGPTAAGAPKGLHSRACDEVTWNAQSQKYLRRGRLDGRRVQMLMDTGCDHTMVLASLVTRSAVDHTSKVPVLCVHGDTLFYPTVMVALQVGLWHERSRVVVAPNLPVDVLLGNDVYSMENEETGRGLAVWTQAT